MANLILKISSSDSIQNARNTLTNSSKDLSVFLSKSAFLKDPNCSVQLLANDEVAANATVTVDFTNMTPGDTIQVGSMILTAAASGSVANTFVIAGTNAATAINLAAAVNASSSNLLSGSPSSEVVTLKSIVTGAVGNMIPIIITQTTPGGMTASGAALSGGSDDTSITRDFKSFR